MKSRSDAPRRAPIGGKADKRSNANTLDSARLTKKDEDPLEQRREGKIGPSRLTDQGWLLGYRDKGGLFFSIFFFRFFFPAS